ncbi:hypothetical protein BCR44DRAFT_1426810 [Catenaria anguillulae PL171]|uniref:Uncharacterized protein n=1 Tax=Catenaria anguillulae PL171 TaxID=765915 RepID=A0A1Y2HYD8_9FUNG|nr:hypothetical protein BCR44DRAFT_1426810 [Catenaria anguillulae PL171]
MAEDEAERRRGVVMTTGFRTMVSWYWRLAAGIGFRGMGAATVAIGRKRPGNENRRALAAKTERKDLGAAEIDRDC